MTRYAPQWVQAQSYPASVDRRLIGAVWPQATASGCAVSVQTGTTVMNVAPGWVVVPSANNTGSVLCTSDAVEVVTLDPCPASGTNRIDLVVCQVSSVDIGTAAGDAFIFTFVKGTPAASPAVPALPAGSVALAQVLLIGGGVSVLSANITDLRPAGPNNAQPSTSALVSRTDANGVVWVAKGGVKGGLWRPATSVLACHLYRSGAYNVTPTITPIAWNAAWVDPYGLLGSVDGAGYFTVPVAGRWRVSALYTFNTQGSSQTADIFILRNGGSLWLGGGFQTNGWVHPSMTTWISCVLGDRIGVGVSSSGTAPANDTLNNTWVQFTYEGNDQT